jgi:hypothetical protein
MPGCALLVGLVSALSLQAPGPSGDWRPGERGPDLEVRLGVGGDGQRALTVGPERRAPDEPPPCIGEICQVRVEVPGYPTTVGRPHRSDLVLALVDRAGIEPFATIAWAFVATGLRLEWTPPALAVGDPAALTGSGWGSVFVRLRFRIDPMNHPVLPHRHRSRADPQPWSRVISPRA